MQGKWICTHEKVETPLFQKVIDVRDIASAKINISGLGFFFFKINGRRVSEDRFVPALTDYRERDTSSFYYPIHDRFTAHRVLYMTYDVTEFLREGENVIEVIVGNGWYRQTERIGEGKCSFSDRPAAVFEMTVTHADGTKSLFCTDGSEKAFVYPIKNSNLFLGENWDMRMFSQPLPEVPLMLHDFTPERMEKQTCPADRIIRTIVPKMWFGKNGGLILDAGENITGWVSFKAKGDKYTRNTVVTLRFAEEMKDGELDFHSTGGRHTCASGAKQIQTDRFVLSGEEQVLRPEFVWHGFRYCEIKMNGPASLCDFRVEVVHTDLEVVSEFDSDNEMLNWIREAYIRSQLGNFHTSIPSDCPHRERLGYTGDGQVCSEIAMLSLSAREAYRKWIRDILDCQCSGNGHIQHTAPFMGGGGGPGGWGGAIVFVPYNFYKIYGERGILEETWQPMRRWIEYMVSRSEGNLVTHEEAKGWCLGDWETPEKVIIPEEYVNTCFLVKAIACMKEIAVVLGEDAHDLEEIARNCRNALHQKYYADGRYAGGVQGADAFALWAKLPKHEGLIEKIREKYDALGRFDTGIFGTDILIEVLFENGLGETAVRLLTSENTEVGFNFMKSRGATTLYESLNDDKQSHNHPMFGACVRHFYSGLLGIRPKRYTSGYGDIVISPDLTTCVRRASGRIMTGWGEISVSFDRDRGYVEAEVPQGVNALIRLGKREYSLYGGKTRVLI